MFILYQFILCTTTTNYDEAAFIPRLKRWAFSYVTVNTGRRKAMQLGRYSIIRQTKKKEAAQKFSELMNGL